MQHNVTAHDYPSRIDAEKLLLEAEPHNPGKWVAHSRVAAFCAERIAAASGLNHDKAYVLGLLHDIGRRFGISHMAHAYKGWKYMLELGYPAVAKVCLTHPYNTQSLDDAIGNMDITKEQLDELSEALQYYEYDDYDRLIQLCDSIAMAEGVVDIEERLSDVKSRYGEYPQRKWDKNLELKKYFEKKAGVASIYDLLRK
jgi:HD superfamily phosphodiesterase